MLVDKNKLHHLLVKLPQIKLAYLIGSYASGYQRQDSDVDIVLIVEEKSLDQLDYGKLYLQVHQCVNHPDLDLRLVLPSQTDPLFLFEIINKGKLLYERNKGERVNFEVKSMKYYYDTRYLRQIFNLALEKSFKQKTYGHR